MRTPDFLTEALLVSSHRRNQWKSCADLAELQQERLRILAAHAARNVPFHKKRMHDAGVASIRCIDDLSALPMTSKQDVRRHADSMVDLRQSQGRLYRFSTTGTTGEPLVHYYGHEDAIQGAALRQFTLGECGFAPGDLMANLAFGVAPRFPLQPLLYRVRNISPSESPETSYPLLRAAAPDVVFAYPSVLAILARTNLASGTPFRIPKSITVSETMRPMARRLIQDSFGCGIRSYYGASECWAIGWECEKGSLHVNSDSVIVEAVDDAGHPVREGVSGELLVTPLWRFAMPFIRYRIGDCGTLGSGCACGRGLQVIKSLDGRTTDVILLPSGKYLPWIYLEVVIGSLKDVESYQVVQEKSGSLNVKVIPRPGAQPGLEERIKAGILPKLPEKMEICVESADRIPRGGRGKARDFISRMKPPF